MKTTTLTTLTLGKRFSISLFICSFLLFFPFDTIPGQEINSTKIKLGVLAKRGPERCLTKWGPTAIYLTENVSGYTFEIVPLGYSELFPSVENGEVDFILANSSFYVELEMKLGVQRIVTLNNLRLGKSYTVYGGVIFSKADRDDIKTIHDLKGKRFISLDEKAFASWLTVLRELKENDIDPYRDFANLEFRKPMDSVVYAVLNGEADAGSIRTDLLEQMAFEGKIRLEEFHIINRHDKNIEEIEFLHSTRMYPEWPLAKVKHTSDDLAKKVAVALIEMPSESEAAIASRSAGWTIPLNYQSVHDSLKFLKISPYEEYGKITIRNALSQYGYWVAGFLGLLFLVFITNLARINTHLKVSVSKQEKEIEERKKAQETLRESEERYRNLVETSQDLIVKCDTNGCFTYLNPAWETTLGYKTDEMLGHCFSEFKTPEQAEIDMKTFKSILEGKETFGYETTYISKFGETVHLVFNVRFIKNTDGEVIGTQGTAHNITERKRTEEELQKMQKLESIGVLAGGIAHDFNNLLAAIRNNIYLAMMHVDRENIAYENLESTEKIIHKATNLTQQLLTFARGGAPVKKTASIVELINESAEFVLKGSNVNCEYNMGDNLWTVEVDEGQINQVIHNLILNAEQSMPEGGKIRVFAGNCNFDSGIENKVVYYLVYLPFIYFYRPEIISHVIFTIDI